MPLDPLPCHSYNGTRTNSQVGDADVQTLDHIRTSRADSPLTPVADPSTFYGLVDADGKLVAADETIARWLDDDIPPREADESGLERLLSSPSLGAGIQRVICENICVEFHALLQAGPRTGDSALVTLRPLHGAATLALVAVQYWQSSPDVAALDALTKLPDRRAIADRVDAWRQAAAPATPRFAVLFLDLDGFKAINDSHGHAVGDAVLQALATRWLGCVREGDLVARYGGDEFVFLIRDASTAHEVDPVIRRVLDATRNPLTVGELSLQVSATIGASAPTDANWTTEDLLAEADRIMYARKGRVLR